jgi:hypothetical protein
MTDLVTYRATGGTRRLLVIACGAIARELIEIAQLDRLDGIEVAALPAELHNRPQVIPDRVRERIRAAKAAEEGFERIVVGYADCGTGGLLDRVCAEEGVVRLPGAHCYELFTGRQAFADLHDEEPGTFYLTDYLARHVNVLVFAGLGLDTHPELAPLYFGNYRRVVYLAQTDDAELDRRAREAAERLGLEYRRRRCGHGELRTALQHLASREARPNDTDRSGDGDDPTRGRLPLVAT